MAKYYFLAANFWLFATIAAWVGKKAMRSQPDEYAFFGVGKWLEAGEYSRLTIGLTALTVVFFALWLVTAFRTRSTPGIGD